jgi:AcrR family transcriptional regulator
MNRIIIPVRRGANENRITHPFHATLLPMVQRADAQKNRAHLLSVARAMMQKGDLAPSFNELAKKAGVGVGTVYRHFADHQALLAGLVEAQLTELEALLAEARANEDPAQALERLFRGAVTLELHSPVIAQLLASPAGASRQVTQRLGAIQAAAEAIVLRARKAKVIRADMQPGDLRRLVCGLELAARTGDHPAEAARRFVDIVLAGLRCPP